MFRFSAVRFSAVATRVLPRHTGSLSASSKASLIKFGSPSSAPQSLVMKQFSLSLKPPNSSIPSSPMQKQRPCTLRSSLPPPRAIPGILRRVPRSWLQRRTRVSTISPLTEDANETVQTSISPQTPPPKLDEADTEPKTTASTKETKPRPQRHIIRVDANSPVLRVLSWILWAMMAYILFHDHRY